MPRVSKLTTDFHRRLSKNAAFPTHPRRNLSLEPIRLIGPSASSPSVLVVGGGVTGIISSWVLFDRGYHVTIVSKE